MRETQAVSCDRCGAPLQAESAKGGQVLEGVIVAGPYLRCPRCCYINRFASAQESHREFE